MSVSVQVFGGGKAVLVTEEQLENRFGLKYSARHRRRLIEAGKFPRPVRLSARRFAWVESEVETFVSQRVAERDGSAR